MADKTNEPEPEDEGPYDDGPIVLPEGASCATCAYSVLIEVEVQGKIATKKEGRRFCRRNPPMPMLIPTGPNTATLGGQFPPVADEAVCFEYDIAPLGLLSANG